MAYLIKSLFARIWALWSLVAFCVTSLVVWFILVVFNKGKGELDRALFFQKITGVWGAVYFFLSGFYLRIQGKEHFDKLKDYVIVCNHRSFMDIFIMAYAIPVVKKSIGKDAFAKVPIFKTIYRSGAVLINRASAQSRLQSYMRMRNLLTNGCSICIYPEGTRNRTDAPLLPFQRGAFRLAIETKTPILPAVIMESEKAISAKRFFYALPCKIRVYFLEPIPINGEEDEESLREKLHREMSLFYEKALRREI